LHGAKIKQELNVATINKALLFRIFATVMTFIEKYKVLQDKNFLTDMITESVYDTMHLEGQGLPKEKIKEFVVESLEKLESKTK
jgi:rRNA-processing protein FCF1